MRIRLCPYNIHSQSAKALARELGILRINQQDTNYKPKIGDLTFCWGLTHIPLFPSKVYNKPNFVANVLDKLKFFQYAQGAEGFQTPPFTTNREEASEWPICVARTVLKGHEGAGIVITENPEKPPVAPLYTKYIKKQREFRIHVAFGNIIDMQRKIRRTGTNPEDWRIRNTANGFIFARNSGLPSETSQRAALAAMQHFELDYGAIDLIETKNGETYVLEINSAPGIENSSVQHYAKAFREEIARRTG